MKTNTTPNALFSHKVDFTFLKNDQWRSLLNACIDAEFILQSYGRQMSKMCTQSIELNFEDVQNVQTIYWA